MPGVAVLSGAGLAPPQTARCGRQEGILHSSANRAGERKGPACGTQGYDQVGSWQATSHRASHGFSPTGSLSQRNTLDISTAKLPSHGPRPPSRALRSRRLHSRMWHSLTPSRYCLSLCTLRPPSHRAQSPWLSHTEASSGLWSVGGFVVLL